MLNPDKWVVSRVGLPVVTGAAVVAAAPVVATRWRREGSHC